MKKIDKFITETLIPFFCFLTLAPSVSAQELTPSISPVLKMALTEAQQEKTEEQLLNNPLITFLLKYMEINKLTIFAVGLTTIGILFLLMSIFIPRLALRQEQSQKTMKSNVSSRHNIHKKILPIKEIVLITGLILVLIGVIIQTFNHIS